MSHRRLALAALGAASLLAAAAPASAAPPPPEVHLPNLRIAEADAANAGALTINVALSRPNPYAHPISVGVGDYTHVVVRGSSRPRTYGTATAGADYKPIAPFRLEWAPGQQVATFAVGLLGDTLDEADENINVRISAPSGVDIGDNDIDIVLDDNDPLGTTDPLAPPLVQFPNAQLSEPDTGCVPYLVSLHLARPAPPAGGSVLVGDFTATHGTATAGSDYLTFPAFRLGFPAGATTARFAVTICGDSVPEADEEIDIRASGATGVRLVDNDLDLILRNDD